MNTLVLICAFIMGFSIMTVELLGGKILSPYFGGSVYVWGSIITVFMLALSIGYLVGGKLSLKEPNTRKYGVIFIAASLTTLPLDIWHSELSDWVFMQIEDPRYGSLVTSVILFLIPTTIMGMVAPYSVRLLVANAESSGQTAGFLYFVSTLGSALGTIMTSFYLVLWFELDSILYGVTIVLAVVGLIAMLFPKPLPKAEKAELINE
ncbi:fused MFS/spermidine synthase [Kangiella geojedonensis]|uniref:Glycosyl transferase n=1 Tax=Kangiella geojedonensis TaxID=914150 RepID=A0A0F6RBL5_9GAMM|nr:fused MFS/spermidine synthase [Kangiella geojedonensis]AKE51668.1 glycosyl transferase [Kangiella geojedonensis]